MTKIFFAILKEISTKGGTELTPARMQNGEFAVYNEKQFLESVVKRTTEKLFARGLTKKKWYKADKSSMMFTLDEIQEDVKAAFEDKVYEVKALAIHVT